MKADTKVEKSVVWAARVAFGAPVVAVALMYVADATGLPGLWLLPVAFLAVMSPLLIVAGYAAGLGCQWLRDKWRDHPGHAT